MKNVSLRLTEDPQLLAELERNNAFVPRGPLDKKRQPTGEKTYVAKADAHAYEFVPGKVITVPENIARMIKMNSGVFVGGTPKKIVIDGVDRHFNSAEDAEYVSVIDVVEMWEMGQVQPSAKAAQRTTCPLCNANQHTVDQLRAHMLECEEDAAVAEELKAANA